MECTEVEGGPQLGGEAPCRAGMARRVLGNCLEGRRRSPCPPGRPILLLVELRLRPGKCVPVVASCTLRPSLTCRLLKRREIEQRRYLKKKKKKIVCVPIATKGTYEKRE